MLECAARVLDEGGLDALTIRRVSEESRVSAPTIYELFGDKAGLTTPLAERAFSQVVDRLRAVEGPGGPRTYARRAFREIIQFGREHPEQFHLIGKRVSLPAMRSLGLENLQAPVRALVGSNRIAADDAQLLRNAAWVVLHGLVLLPPSRPDIEWRDDLADVLCDALFRELEARAVTRNGPHPD